MDWIFKKCSFGSVKNSSGIPLQAFQISSGSMYNLKIIGVEWQALKFSEFLDW